MDDVVKTPWWRLPFAAETWRRTGYALVALRVGLLALPMALVGAVRPAVRLQRRPRPPAARPVAGRRSLLALNLFTCVATLYAWSLVPMNLGFPLRVDGSLEGSWGGPTLAGAWAHRTPGRGCCDGCSDRGSSPTPGGLPARVNSLEEPPDSYHQGGRRCDLAGGVRRQARG